MTSMNEEKFADGTEHFRPRTIEEQVAEQNLRAASSGLRLGGERRRLDRGCSLIGEQRRETDRRTA